MGHCPYTDWNGQGGIHRTQMIYTPQIKTCPELKQNFPPNSQLLRKFSEIKYISHQRRLNEKILQVKDTRG